MDSSQYIVLITSDNVDIYDELRQEVQKYVDKERIVDIWADLSGEVRRTQKWKEHSVTKVEKYSSDPLCNHWLVESVGAFCSFAPGTDVVPNHPINYILTAAFLYMGGENDEEL